MLANVDEKRVLEIGGKAAILEEIVRRLGKKANVPGFSIYGENRGSVMSKGDYVLRSSSELDSILGILTLVSSFNW